jgi:replicative DNA helicase
MEVVEDDELKKRIQDGLDGKYEGLYNGFERINEYIFGVQRKCITLIGGQSGCFKTTMLDFIVLNALMDAEKKGITLNVHYYSFEIDRLTKKCNWISVQIYLIYGVIVPPEKIKGFGKNRLTKEEQELVNSVSPEVNRLFNKINFTFKSENPTGIYKTIWNFMEKRGTFTYEHYTDDEGEEKKKVKKYTLNDPDEYNLGVIDHLYLTKKEKKFTTKDNIDKLSEYQVELRNLFGFSWINLQQFNQGLSAVERQKFKGVDISPAQGDFKDTTNPYQDADVVIGLMNPYKLDLDTCLGYDVKKLRSNFIMFKVIKNRLAGDNIAFGLYANPKSGSFTELPKDMNTADYQKYKN